MDLAVRKLKRSVIKEEFLAITADFHEALILNQFIYWSERIKDFDSFLAEENHRLELDGGHEEKEFHNLSYGWIYKKADELINELMTSLNRRTLRKKINNLNEKGFILIRKNPRFKWDQTFQYRVDFTAVINALNNKGYDLQGFKRLVNLQCAVLPIQRGKNTHAIPEITNRDYHYQYNETDENQLKAELEAHGLKWSADMKEH